MDDMQMPLVLPICYIRESKPTLQSILQERGHVVYNKVGVTFTPMIDTSFQGYGIRLQPMRCS
jgi:hypothetical protein